MKFLLAVLLITGVAFADDTIGSYNEWTQDYAKDTIYKNGNGCSGCDSIHRLGFDYDGGGFLYEMPYKHGVVNGVVYYYTKFHENDTLQLIQYLPYTNGKMNGRVIWYDDQGSISYIFHYSHGITVGIDSSYCGNDRLLSIGIHNGNHALNIVYYESGSVMWETPLLSSGVKEGIQIGYSESGHLVSTAKYHNGALVGYKKCADGRKGNDELNCLH